MTISRKQEFEKRTKTAAKDITDLQAQLSLCQDQLAEQTNLRVNLNTLNEVAKQHIKDDGE